jgi:hypothetical protein
MIHLWLQVNRIGFEFTALIKVEGALTVEATYEPAGPARVDIKFQKSTLVCAPALPHAGLVHCSSSLQAVHVSCVQNCMNAEISFSVASW